MEKVGKDELVIEFGGHDLEPNDLEPRSALEVVSAYLDLLQKVAEDESTELPLAGIEVRHKCTAIVFKTSDPEVVKRAARKALSYVSDRSVPRGLAVAVARLREAVIRLPAKQRNAKVHVGLKFHKPLTIKPTQATRAPSATISLRATLIRIGGSQPAAKFESKSEGRFFTLHATREQAVGLSQHLYREVDLDAQVTRDEEGSIDDGELLGFRPVEEAPATEAWREWFKATGGEWDEVGDILGELGRRDEHDHD